MIGLAMLTGVAALAALVFVVLAYNHRAEVHRRRLVRDWDAIARRMIDRSAGRD